MMKQPYLQFEETSSVIPYAVLSEGNSYENFEPSIA